MARKSETESKESKAAKAAAKAEIAARKKAAKAAAPKKERKPRATPPVRKRKDSPAGHYEDLLSLVSTRLKSIASGTEGWPAGGDGSDFSEIQARLTDQIARFHGLTQIVNADGSTGFKPSRKRPGRTAANPFVVNQQVTLDVESMDKVKRIMSAADVDCVFRIATFAKEGERDLPVVCCGLDGTLPPAFVGYYKRQHLTAFVEPSNAAIASAA